MLVSLTIDIHFAIEIGQRRSLAFDSTGEKGRSESEIVLRSDMDSVKIEELPLYSFEMLATATNNFDLSNKLGMGGFGPVYKVSIFY